MTDHNETPGGAQPAPLPTTPDPIPTGNPETANPAAPASELTDLSIKDLRQLAGEHQIANRSRLGRDQLIGALSQVIAGAAAQQTIPETQPASANATADSEPELLTPESLGAEPEVLAAAPVAAPSAPVGEHPAAGEPGPAGAEGDPNRRRRRRRRRGRGRGRGGDGQPQVGAPGDDSEFDGEDGDGEDSGEAGTPPAAAGTQPGAAPAANAGAQSSAQPANPAQGQRPPNGLRPGPVSAPASAQPLPKPGTLLPNRSAAPGQPSTAPLVAPEQQQAPRSGRPLPVVDRSQLARPGNGPAGPSQPRPQGQPGNGQPRNESQPRSDQPQRDQRNDQRAPRPRLDGTLRGVPSVLERLCTFSKGILELCDPATPSWAQPRLAELLAEIGVVPTPGTGLPHPDFHEIVGTDEASPVPPGHISAVVAPGFSLRGDRGDLFALRKAKVRVNPAKAPVPAPAPVAAPAAPAPAIVAEPPVAAPAAAEAPAAPAVVTTPAVVEAAVPAETVVAAPAVVPAPADVAAQVVAVSAEPVVAAVTAVDAAPIAPVVEAPAPTPPEPAAAIPPVAPTANDGEGAHPKAEPGAAAAGAARHHGSFVRPAPAAPAQGRRPDRTHKRESASAAPSLPLAAQLPEELAQRPKAEGFRALGLNEQILSDLADVGYEKPTPIQEEAIPAVLAGKDLIGQAQTGTGKTAAYVLPLLQLLYSYKPAAGDRQPVALVLCPTRELARQVHGEFNRMAGKSGARAALIYGGVDMDAQIRELERSPHAVIGTPGRIIDLMRRRALDLSRLRLAVLDEADQMLDIGFWPDVNWIISHTPHDRQLMMFSATFPEPVKQLAAKHMKTPAHIRIAPQQVTVEQVDQKYIAVARERKNDLLAHFIERFEPPQLVVFCRTKHQTDRVAEVLKRKKISAGAIHGDLPQSKRERTLQDFRAGTLQCLIATNVAARGLDIPTVSHVVNYDVPEMPEEYVHRIGRTARNGASGVARTFITPEDGQFLTEIEKHIGLMIEEEQIDGFTPQPGEVSGPRRITAQTEPGSVRMLKPLSGVIKLRRRR